MNKVIWLVLALAVLLGAWWFLGHREDSLQEAGVPQAQSVDTLSMDRIVLERHNEEPITFEREATGFWKMTEPLEDQVNANLVAQLEKGLAQMKFVNRISERSGQHAAFQIDDVSAIRLKAYAGDVEQADLYLGKVTPDRQHVYARLAGSDVVFSATGGGAMAAMRTRDLDSFRSRDVMDREPASFDSVDVRSGSTTYRLVRVDTATWDIRIGQAPAKRASASMVDGFLQALGHMKCSGFRADSVTVNWDRPEITISAWILGEPEVSMAMVAGANATYYLRSSTRTHDLAVFESVYKTFQRDPKEFLEQAQ